MAIMADGRMKEMETKRETSCAQKKRNEIDYITEHAKQQSERPERMRRPTKK